MQVTNVSVKYIRPGHKDLKAWAEDKDNLYVGRAGVVFIDGERYPKAGSPFANPYKIGVDGDRAEVLRKYRAYICANPDLLAGIRAAAQGKKYLGCWCKPEACHADILAELLATEQKSS